MAKKLLIILIILLAIPIVSADHMLSFTADNDNRMFFLINDYFESSPPNYDNSCPHDKTYTTTTSPNCWSVEIKYGNDDIIAKQGDNVELNDYFNVNVKMDATYNGKVTDNWKVTYTFKLKRHDLIGAYNGQNKLQNIGDNTPITVTSVNNYGGVIPGSYEVIIANGKIQIAPETITSPSLFSGTKTDYLNIPNLQLGENTITVTPFIDIETGSDKLRLYSPDYTISRVNIVPNIDLAKDTSTKCSSSSDCPSGFSCVDYSSTSLCSKFPEAKKSGVDIRTISLIVSFLLILTLLIKMGRKNG